MRRNIILIGFMGTGKTTVGKKLAASLGFEFVDTDAQVEASAGRPIPQIFAAEGESGFRDRETATLERVLEGQDQVISTGGGIILRDENRRRIRHEGYCVWLKAQPETIFRRVIGNEDRPLLKTPNPRETIRQLLEQRLPLYAETAHLEIATDPLTAEDIAYGISESAKLFFRKRKAGPVVT